ncbi:MAG: hypothetical protein ACOCWR_01610, partial [Oceanidesulfovibrio sp.]
SMITGSLGMLPSASLAEGYTLDEALTFLEEVVAEELGGQPGVDYKGESREFRESTGSLLFAFGFALLVVFWSWPPSSKASFCLALSCSPCPWPSPAVS